MQMEINTLKTKTVVTLDNTESQTQTFKEKHRQG